MTERSLYPAIFAPIVALLVLGTLAFFGVFATALMHSSVPPDAPSPIVSQLTSPGATGPTPAARPLAESEEPRLQPQGQPQNQPAGSPSTGAQRYPDSAR